MGCQRINEKSTSPPGSVAEGRCKRHAKIVCDDEVPAIGSYTRCWRKNRSRFAYWRSMLSLVLSTLALAWLVVRRQIISARRCARRARLLFPVTLACGHDRRRGLSRNRISLQVHRLPSRECPAGTTRSGPRCRGLARVPVRKSGLRSRKIARPASYRVPSR